MPNRTAAAPHVWCSGFEGLRVLGLGVAVQGLGFRVESFGATLARGY